VSVCVCVWVCVWEIRLRSFGFATLWEYNTLSDLNFFWNFCWNVRSQNNLGKLFVLRCHISKKWRLSFLQTKEIQKQEPHIMIDLDPHAPDNLISRSRGRCFSSIVLTRCLPLLVISWYDLLPDSLIQATNVIPKLNLWNRLHIYKLLMSIKIEIRGPSSRCLYPKKEYFVYFSESHRDSTIALRVEIFFLEWTEKNQVRNSTSKERVLTSRISTARLLMSRDRKASRRYNIGTFPSTSYFVFDTTRGDSTDRNMKMWHAMYSFIYGRMYSRWFSLRKSNFLYENLRFSLGKIFSMIFLMID